MMQALFFDFGGTIDLYPEIQSKAVVAVERIMGVLNRSGIDMSAYGTPAEFYAHLNAGMARYQIWKKQSFIEISTEKLWKNYLIPEHPQRHRLTPVISEEVAYLMENGRYTRSVRPEMEEVLKELMTLGIPVERPGETEISFDISIRI